MEKFKILVFSGEEESLYSFLKFVNNNPEYKVFSVDTKKPVERCLSCLENNFIDIVVLDIDSSSTAADDILQVIEDKQPSANVIIISNVIDNEKLIRYSASGADRYLGKPFDPMQLLRMIKSTPNYKSYRKFA